MNNPAILYAACYIEIISRVDSALCFNKATILTGSTPEALEGRSLHVNTASKAIASDISTTALDLVFCDKLCGTPQKPTYCTDS